MLQQGWYGCYDCTNYAAERDPDQLTDYRYILYKVYSRYRRHKAAQIKSAFEPQVKLVRREHDAHCAARKQKRDYYLYQVRKVRPAQKGSHQKIVHCLARLTCRDQYQCDCSGKTLAWTAYGAVSLLSLLFVPDKEVALTFVFLLGYYPLVKPKFEHIRPALLRGLCKLLLCNGGILLMYGLVLLLIPGGSISQEMRTTALAVSLTTLAMGNVAFLLYDRALHNMLQVYRILWQPRLHKMLGR